jgi:FlaG/FlaF family flagellin (archaellin)
MDENIVTWNVTNWITVVLMVAIGFAILGVIQAWWTQRQSNVVTMPSQSSQSPFAAAA